MDFIGLGPLEVLLILIVALIVFGPDKIPEIGRKLGTALRTLKKATLDLTAEVTREVEGETKDQPPRPREKDSGNITE